MKTISRLLFLLRLWYADLTVALLEEQKARVFADLLAARRARAELIKNGLQKGHTP